MNGHCNDTVEECHCNNGFSDLIIDTKKSAVHRKHETSRKEAEDKSRLPAIEAAYTSILRELGEDTDRQGLLRTPLRAAKAMQFLTKGYHETVDGESGPLSVGDTLVLLGLVFLWSDWKAETLIRLINLIGVMYQRGVDATLNSCSWWFLTGLLLYIG